MFEKKTQLESLYKA